MPQARVPVAVAPSGRKPFVSFNIPTLHYIEDDARFEAMRHQRLPDDFEIRDALETIRFLGGEVVRIYTLSARKWVGGYLTSEPGTTIAPDVRGSGVSPILAKVHFHYALDL